MSLELPACKRLRASQVKPITLARYSESVQDFETWCEVNRKNIGPRKIDLTMTEYLHKLCEEGASILTARSTVYGYIMLRMSSDLPEKLLLNQSKSALKGWVTRFPNHSKCGIDLRIWDVVARQCLKQGQELAAAAIVLQGDTYARPHELLHLKREAVLLPNKSKSRFWGVVFGLQEHGCPTKTGLYDDCILLDSVGREDLAIVLKSLYKKTSRPHDLLFPGLTLSKFADAINHACDALDLRFLRLTPHILRHSGPSTDCFAKSRSLLEIQNRGRWQAPSSVNRYRKPGRMLLLQQRIPASIWKMTAKARKEVIEHFGFH